MEEATTTVDDVPTPANLSEAVVGSPRLSISTDRFEAVKEYTRRGWVAIPVHSVDDNKRCSCRAHPCGLDNRNAGKHPEGREWQKRNAPSGPDQVRLWHPEGGEDGHWNIGLLTGVKSGFFVFDVDPENGGGDAFTQLVVKHGEFPTTFTVRTGSGGRHLYFRMPDFPVTNATAGLPDGIDIRGNGGQVVAAPSRSGKGEYLVEVDAPIAAAPEWLLAELRSGVRPDVPTEIVMIEGLPVYSDLDEFTQKRYERYAQAAIAGAAQNYVETRRGGGWNALWAMTCSMVEVAQSPWNLVTYDQIMTALERARQDRIARLNVPGAGASQTELTTTWRRALKRLAGQGRPAPETVDEFDGVMFNPPEGDSPGQVAPGESTFIDPVEAMLAKMLDRDAVDALPNPQPLIRDWLDLDSESWLIAPPGGFKSFIALDMAAHVSNGRPWRGHPVHQGRVVYLVAEGSKGVKLRMQAWEAEYGERIKDLLVYPEAIQVAPDSRDKPDLPGMKWRVFVEACRRLKPAMVVLDTQARITAGLEENSAGQMGVLFRAVTMVREATGACVLVVHHIGRNGGDARGTSAIDAAQDGEIRVDRAADKKSLTATISMDKYKDGPEDGNMPIQMVVKDLGVCPVTDRPLTSLAVRKMDPFATAETTQRSEPWRESLSENQLRIADIMREHVDRDGLTSAQILSLVNEPGRRGKQPEMPKSSFYTAFNKLKEDKIVVACNTASKFALDSIRNPPEDD